MDELTSSTLMSRRCLITTSGLSHSRRDRIPGWSSSFISNRGQTKVFPTRPGVL
ncbi:hypothetical protein DPMN_155588 [Dreissena polymorpha]|uniref:Uncharacterized protein n=1 Tax=Dreissena polymorpha TaxID=45954 RepID=A0A9D4FS14_DREPO|nr:hypothetical protein DPMN_155588 [Dreissena polymorpha]